MIREALTHWPWKWMPLVGLCIFFGVFIGLLFWTRRKGANELYQKIALIPLSDEETQK